MKIIERIKAIFGTQTTVIKMPQPRPLIDRVYTNVIPRDEIVYHYRRADGALTFIDNKGNKYILHPNITKDDCHLFDDAFFENQEPEVKQTFNFGKAAE